MQKSLIAEERRRRHGVLVCKDAFTIRWSLVDDSSGGLALAAAHTDEDFQPAPSSSAKDTEISRDGLRWGCG